MGQSDLAGLVRSSLVQLSTRRPIFHSEADFQHELALEISRADSRTEVRLERPMRSPNLPAVNLDVLLMRDGFRFALELKYVTAALVATVRGEEFALRNQSAQDLRRYDILKDVTRIEALLQSGRIHGGLSITITNDRQLWSPTQRARTFDEMFRIHQGRTINGSLAWSTLDAPGTIRSRELPLELHGTYDLDWVEYSRIDDVPRNGEFRMLLIEVSGLAQS